MKKQTTLSCLILVLFVLLFSVRANGQFIVEQTSQEIPFVYSLIPEDVEFNSIEDEMDFISNISIEDLISAAMKEDYEILEENSVMYLDGGNFAMETNSEESGKISMISEIATGNLFIIMWAEQMILEVGPDDLKNIQEQSNDAIEAMIKDLPPEQQEAVRAEMLKESKSSDESSQTTATGNTAKINNFNCEEYKVKSEEEIKTIMMATDTQGLLKAVDLMANRFDALFEMNEDEGFDEWQIVPGKIPIQVKSFSMDMMMGEPVIFVETITEIKKEKPPAHIFQIPDEAKGFTRTSYMEMMENMMEGMEDY